MRTNQIKSIFMEVFGANPAARVLDYLLSIYPLDCSIADIAENSQTSRTTLHYDILPDLSKRKVIAVRAMGKLKLYKLDKESPIARKLLEIDKELITGELKRHIKSQQAITA